MAASAAAAAARVGLLLLALACTAQAVDRTLGTVSASCKDRFDSIIADNYASDANCAGLIRRAMSTVPDSAADCPLGVKAEAGSEVQQCMSKSKSSVDDFTSFIKDCEVLNVNERAGAGEAEAAADAMPSCFPRFNSLDAFKEFLATSSSSSSSSAPAKPASSSAQGAAASGLLLAAAAAGALLM